jgi:hypothetical protein
VLQSLVNNGFSQDPSTLGLWKTEEPGQPFDQVLLIPEIRAVASGNDIGLQRIADVISGAPSLRPDVSELVGALGPVESAYVDSRGCVPLGEAFGPDATDDDVTAYFAKNDPSELAEADGWAVGIASAHRATATLSLPAEEVADDAIVRAGIVDRWPGIQTGVPLSDVATSQLTAGQFERFDFDVESMPAFVSMVLTHDAPWALCPTSRPA